MLYWHKLVAKTAYGAQVATGRAWKEAAERNLKRNSPEFKQLVQDHMKGIQRWYCYWQDY